MVNANTHTHTHTHTHIHVRIQGAAKRQPDISTLLTPQNLELHNKLSESSVLSTPAGSELASEAGSALDDFGEENEEDVNVSV